MGRWRRLAEGVAPAEAGETAEVEVVGVDLGLVFHCEGSDVSVGDEVAADAGGQQVSLEEGEVVRAGVDGSDVRKSEPVSHDFEGILKLRWITHWPRTGYHSDEPRRNNPRKPDPLSAVHQALPPAKGVEMEW